MEFKAVRVKVAEHSWRRRRKCFYSERTNRNFLHFL